ncbi:methyltransferase, partial [Pseudomonas sp. F1002]|nr:methyltransferase [Pseudomonas sp. F1002]
MKATLAALSLAALLAPALSQAAEAPVSAEQYATVLAGSWRVSANSARDGYRHPQQTLEFFGLRADQTLIEITPGGGWYSELLAPLLKDNGHYIAAVQAPN